MLFGWKMWVIGSEVKTVTKRIASTTLFFQGVVFALCLYLLIVAKAHVQAIKNEKKNQMVSHTMYPCQLIPMAKF